jgi:hypothetical protein
LKENILPVWKVFTGMRVMTITLNPTRGMKFELILGGKMNVEETAVISVILNLTGNFIMPLAVTENWCLIPGCRRISIWG